MKRYIRSIVPEFILSRYRDYKLRRFHKDIQGDRVFCPICRSRFDYFAAFGLTMRENARCHTCNSLERHRLMYLYLENVLDLFGNQEPLRILHFAPAFSFYKIFSAMDHVDYVPCDLEPEIYNYKGDTKIMAADITRIPFGDDTFDLVLCNQVLEHVPNDGLAMRELFRVMKTGGSGIIQAPVDYERAETYEDFSITSPEEREKAFGQHDHVRWYGRDYPDKLRAAGFTVKEDDYARRFSEADIMRFGLVPSEIIYYCTKPSS